MASVADYNVANASGAAVRSDLNNIFQAVVTLNSGTSEPSTMYPFMIWVDTTNNVVKMRNGANDGWLTMPFAMNASNSVDINAGTIDGVSLGATNAITSAVISGDLTVDTSTLKVDSTNNRVGIGTTSPGFHVDIQKSLSETYSASARPTALTRIYNTNTADNNHATLEFGTEPTSGNGGVAYIGSTVTSSNLADLFFGTRTGASTFATHMTIKSDGKTGINTTSPSQLLHISDTGSAGIYLEADSDNVNEDHVAEFHMSSDGGATYHKLGTNNNNHGYINVSEALVFERQGSEKARIDTSGRLLVGKTSGSQKLLVSDNANDNTVLQVQNSGNSTPYGMLINFDSASPDDNTRYFIKAQDSSATRFYVYSDGDVWTSDAGTLTSDRSLKTDIADATSKLADINQLQVRNFKWTTDYHPNKQNKHIGFIADEFETVFPSLVTEHNIARDGEDADMKKGIKYGALIPILVKALQEADDKIDALEARIEALEA